MRRRTTQGIKALAPAQQSVARISFFASGDRLQAKGYAKSYLGDPTPERGGGSKRFFQVTAKGITAVNRTHRALENMIEGLHLAGVPHS